MAKTPKTLHVVVVADHRVEGEVIESGLPTGQYACFIGEDRSSVVEKARETVQSWSFSTGYGANSRVDGKPYRLLVGKLAGVVKPVHEYTIEAL